MELRQLKIFCTAAQELNFTKTADNLGYAQSNVTKQIQLLEKELGVKLFERIGKTLYLTPCGKIFFEHSLCLLQKAEDAREAVNPVKFQRVLQIGAAESICVNWLPQIFKHFRSEYPGTNLQLHMESCYHLADMIRANKIDAALVLADKISETDMTVHVLHEEKMCLVASPANKLAAKSNFTPTDFADTCLIITTEGCGYRPLILKMLQNYKVLPARFMELNSVATIKACVLGNMGLAILPYISVKDALESGELTEIPMRFPTFHVYAQLFYHRDKWLYPALAGFIKTVTQL